MTIRFLTAWNGYHEQQVVSGLGSTEETRLIGLGFATADLDGPLGSLKPMLLLAASAVAASHTGNTTETTLATVTIPAGAIGPNGAIHVRTMWSTTNSANNKNLRVRLAGTQLFLLTATTSLTTQLFSSTRNRGSQASQVTGPSSATVFGSTGGAVTTTAIDTSVDTTLTLTAALGLSSESITLESYEIWLVP